MTRLAFTVLSALVALVPALHWSPASGTPSGDPAVRGPRPEDPGVPPVSGLQAPPPHAPVRVPPALMVKIADDLPSEPLIVAKARYDVVITGFLAETTATLTFESDHDRTLEGELYFPLPEGSAVAGYALDVSGEMVDGVIVEAKAARIAFETEVRKGIDPGLVEWVKGSNFKTRVWPIPPRGRRTVRVRYVSDLVTRGRGADAEALYHLPLRFDKPVGELAFKVEVVKGTVRPEVRGGATRLRFEEWEERYVAETVLRDAALREDLQVALPRVPRESVVVERYGGAHYFVVNDLPEAPPAAPSTGGARKRVGVYWDASLSRGQADRRRERALLEAHLAALGDVDVELVVFRDAPEPARSFSVRGGDLRALLAHLDGLAYDGATGLAAVRFTRAPGAGASCDYHLLFSDGLATVGGDRPAAAEVPVYAVTADAQANHALLRSIADESGGAYLNLQRLSDADATAALGAPVYSFLEAVFDPSQIDDVQPAGRRPVLGRFTLSGRLLAPEARLTVRYGYGPGAGVRERSFTLRRAGAASTGLIGRFWAQQKVDALSVRPDENHQALVTLGREFGIVTPGTSLLVLETVEQHLEHGVEPPASRPALRDEYRRRIKERDAFRQKARSDKLDRVAASWRQRVHWWETEFRYPQDLRVRDKGKISGGVAGGVAGGVVAAMEAPPPPPPAGARPAPADSAPMERMRALGYAVAREMDVAEVIAVEGKAEAASGAAAGPSIHVKPWDPATPYLRALRQAGKARAYDVYLTQRKDYGDSPAFFLDCADFFLGQKERATAIRVLTNVAELRLEDARLLRIAAYKLQELAELDLAVDLLEKARRLRPEEPQSHRDLALALALRAEAHAERAGRVDAAAAADYRRAAALLVQVVTEQWDSRFDEIEVVALMELNRLLAVVERAGQTVDVPLDGRFRRLLDLDLRIVLSWDTDLTDMDLWVVEPSGETCDYSHNRTTIGGLISDDFTQGYGPEEYVLRRAMPGRYLIKANFYGSRAQQLTGPTTVQATIITNFGRPDERRQVLTLRLTEAKDVVEVGGVDFGG